MKNIINEETLGQRIKAARIRKGMTQEQLVEVMCIPKFTISTYENDKAKTILLAQIRAIVSM